MKLVEQKQNLNYGYCSCSTFQVCIRIIRFSCLQKCRKLETCERALTFHCECDNDFNRSAETEKTLLPGKLAPSIVGHALHELSQYIWCASQYGAIITAEVQGGY